MLKELLVGGCASLLIACGSDVKLGGTGGTGATGGSGGSGGSAGSTGGSGGTATGGGGTTSGACEAITCNTPPLPTACYAPSGTCSDGVCSYAYLNGASCDDGDPCTLADSCQSGVCAGTPDAGCTLCKGKWESATIDSQGGGLPALLANATGLHASYYSPGGKLMYADKPVDLAWSQPTAIDSNGNVGWWPSLASDANGGLHVSYIGITNPSLFYTHKPAGGSWQQPTSLVQQIKFGGNTSLAIDPNQGLHLSFYDASNKGLRYVYKPALGSWEAPKMLDKGGLHSTLAVDAQGGVHVVYYDSPNFTLKYAHKPPASVWQTPVALPIDTSFAARKPSLAIDAAGGLHLSYTTEEAAPSSTRYLYKPAQGAWQQSVKLAPAASGTMTSLAIDAAGGLHIAYLAGDDATLTYSVNYLHRTPAGAWQTPEVVDVAEWNTYFALTVDSAAGVHIAHASDGVPLRHAYRAPCP